MAAAVADRVELSVHVDPQDGPRRFNELKRDMGGVSSRTLSATLGRLVEEGIVHREVGHRSPLSVRYGLTPKGRELAEVLQPMARWGERWLGGEAGRSRSR